MPIEFRCSVCGKLLRVGDEAADRQAKCPACQAVQRVPSKSSPPDYAIAPPSGPEGPPNYSPQRPGYADNPYAAPSMSGAPFGDPPLQNGPRSGPPWERRGASFGSFFATVKQFYFSPLSFFSEMRRSGGMLPPLSFAAAGSVFGCLFGIGYFVIISLFDPTGPFKMQNMPADGAERVGYLMGMAIGYGCCSGVGLPLLLLLYTLAAAGVFHLSLMALGSANFPYETTLRVVAYAVGATMLIGLVPFCGIYLSIPVQLIFIGIGLAMAQEASGGAAAAAVIAPTVLCCGGYFGLIFMFVFAAGAR
jgi:phage FluMu protein Com